LGCFMGIWGIPNRIMTRCILILLVIDGYWYYSPLW
jgi:hypothetical protein